jgi:hypothetical protein
VAHLALQFSVLVLTHVRHHDSVYLQVLTRFGQFAHAAQAACANVDGARNAVDFNAAMLNIEHKAAASTAL